MLKFDAVSACGFDRGGKRQIGFARDFRNVLRVSGLFKQLTRLVRNCIPPRNAVTAISSAFDQGRLCPLIVWDPLKTLKLFPQTRKRLAFSGSVQLWPAGSFFCGFDPNQVLCSIEKWRFSRSRRCSSKISILRLPSLPIRRSDIFVPTKSKNREISQLDESSRNRRICCRSAKVSPKIPLNSQGVRNRPPLGKTRWKAAYFDSHTLGDLVRGFAAKEHIFGASSASVTFSTGIRILAAVRHCRVSAQPGAFRKQSLQDVQRHGRTTRSWRGSFVSRRALPSASSPINAALAVSIRPQQKRISRCCLCPDRSKFRCLVNPLLGFLLPRSLPLLTGSKLRAVQNQSNDPTQSVRKGLLPAFKFVILHLGNYSTDLVVVETTPSPALI